MTNNRAWSAFLLYARRLRLTGHQDLADGFLNALINRRVGG